MKKSPGGKAARNPSKNKFDPDYFTLPHPLWMIILVLLMAFQLTTTFAPARLPTFLGPIYTFGQYMNKSHYTFCIYTCYFLIVAHSVEAAIAGKICHDRGMTVSATIKWVLSTSVFGFSSLMLKLMPYKPDYKIM